MDEFLEQHPVSGWYVNRVERTAWNRDCEDGMKRTLYIGHFFGYEIGGTGILELTIQFWSVHPRKAMKEIQKSGRCPLEFDGKDVL